MKQIAVSFDIFLGCSHYGAVTTDVQDTIEITDEVAALLQALQENKGEALTKEDILAAIMQGQTELQGLHDKLMSGCFHYELVYWCLDEYSEIDEALEPAFYEDVEAGIYPPDCYDGVEPLDFDDYRDDYLEWVHSHTDDVYFMAERVGVDPWQEPNYDNYNYAILKIEECSE